MYLQNANQRTGVIGREGEGIVVNAEGKRRLKRYVIERHGAGA